MATAVRGGYDEAIELIYFAWRELVAEPDRLLARRGLSRVHHRILYCVARGPGITIGGLCRVLGVSKQAVHQPLAALIDAGLVKRTVDPTNRRIRRLGLTRRGVQLEERLAAVQRGRFERAFRAAGPIAEAHWRDVMKLLAEPDGASIASRRPTVRASVARSAAPQRRISVEVGRTRTGPSTRSRARPSHGPLKRRRVW